MHSSTRIICIAAILFITGFASLAAQRPIASYPFNGNANDRSGNGLHGQIVGGTPTSDRFGHPGAALHFSAAEGDYVVIPHNQLLSFGTHDFTIVAWIRSCEEQTEYAGIVCKGPPNNSYPGYQLHLGEEGEMVTQIGDEGDWSDERRGTTALNDGRWHMLAVTVSPRNNTIRHYVDGVQVTDQRQVYTQRGRLSVSRFDPTPLYIGVERNLDRYFDGDIDDVSLYARALGPQEIAYIFHMGEWQQSDGPAAWYPFNGNAEDESGNGNDGIVHGARLTCDRFGNCRSAYAFDGSQRQYIEVPHAEELSFGTHDFTVVSWVKFCREQPEYAGIVCKGPPNNSYPGYQLHIADGNMITTQIGDEGNWSDERRGLEPLNDGEWHMMAVAVSPTRDEISLYVDGEELTDYRQHYRQRGALNVSRFDPTSLFIGTERNRDRFFTGLIDDVRLFNRQLSDCEMRSLYRENGWTGTSRLPEPRITVRKGLEEFDGAGTFFLSVDCYPDVRWSTGDIGNAIRVHHPGTYRAMVSDGSGCGGRMVEVTIGQADTTDDGLQDNGKEEKHPEAGVAGVADETIFSTREGLTLSPNPATDRTYLTFRLRSATEVTAGIFDMQGRMIGSPIRTHFTAGEGWMTIPTEGLAAGIYVIRLSTGDEILTDRLVVTR